MDKKQLKLIYVHKIGINAKSEGMYEFIFSKDPTNVEVTNWQWDLSPACDNAEPPDSEHIDLILNLKTNKFKLFCLHEAIDREYMHGYHLIHALAYELESDEIDNVDDDDDDDYDDGWGDVGSTLDDEPILVFHYGSTVKDIEDIFYGRDIILKGDDFIHSKEVTIEEE